MTIVMYLCVKKSQCFWFFYVFYDRCVFSCMWQSLCFRRLPDWRYWPRVQREVHAPTWWEYSTAQTNIAQSAQHTRCCSRLPSLNGDHSETKESATMFSSISKRTAEAEKRENETGKCNQQVFHKTPARKRHDRLSQVCPKKYLHTYI